MTNKTNKQLYAELDEKLKQVRANLDEVAKFAEENKLMFKFFGTTYVPKSDDVRSKYSEELLPTEEEEPTEEAGFLSPDDRGTFWISSNCW